VTPTTFEGKAYYMRADIVISNRRDGSKYWAGSESDDTNRARILVHELGHAYNRLFGLGGSAFKDDFNPDGTPNMDAQNFNHQPETKCLP
jgi:hypothetical protein